MTAVKAGDVERILRRGIDPGISVVLVYGPDAGLVHERARGVAERAVADPGDPFQLVRLDGDAVAADPARLADEAGTIGLFGGKRAIWVKPSSRNIAPAVEAVLGAGAPDAVIVLEAGDLARTAPLRACCERSRAALALPCYPDAQKDLGAVVDETFRAAGLALSPEARATLVASLGGDRLATRAELDKVVLYARGQSEVSLADVDAVISNVSALALDALIDAAFGGEPARTDETFRRAREAGITASAILGHALRHALALYGAGTEAAAGGRSPGAAVEAWRGLHFTRREAVTRQLAAWSPGTLRPVIEQLQAMVLASRSMAGLADELASAALLRIAISARASRRRSRVA